MTDYSNIILPFALAGCAACVAVLFLATAGARLWEVVRRWASLGRIQQIVLAAFALGLVHYGATKSISYSDGIRADPNNSNILSNSTVEIHWVRDTSGGIYVPETATVYIDYRLATDTNGVWQSLGSTTVGQWHYSTIFANATNYDYNVWAYYIPPEPVHTNGVWVYKTLRDRAEKNPLPLRARIEVNGKAIATPAEKRKDESK